MNATTAAEIANTSERHFSAVSKLKMPNITTPPASGSVQESDKKVAVK